MSLWKTPIASNYKKDMVLFDYPLLRIWVGSMIVLGLILPFLTSSYFIHLMNLCFLATLGAIGLNIVTGYTGLVSLGTGGFLCAGAFIAVILNIELHTPFWVNIIAALVGGSILGLIAGLPALRLKGIYLLLSTLAIHFIIVYFCGRYQILKGYIGGIPISDPNIGAGVVLNTTIKWYYFLLAILIMVTIFCLNIERTHIGRAWIALRDRDIVANILGVNVGYYKLLSFTFSSGLIGVAGCLTAYYVHFVAYEEFTIWTSVIYLAMIIIGGIGSIAGSYFGAFIVTFLPYFLHWIVESFRLPTRMELYFSSVEQAVFGFIMILFLLVEPMGLVGLWRLKVRPYFELWPFKYRRAIATRR
ncbi:branched-chain amino acid ABC transporter permease [Candidatus Micrarchaeota archaeon]|nr:MAG: branched-chain amino acid ABC transporter permease [Candidatus Micrarchaeota archaeon]